MTTLTFTNVPIGAHTWWHGGPKINGLKILPPCETGARSTAQLAEEAGVDVPAAIAEDGWVYLVNDRRAATMFAAATPTAWLYECLPMGDVEFDPDFTSDIGLISIRCSWALIKRREKPSNRDLHLTRAWMRNEIEVRQL